VTSSCLCENPEGAVFPFQVKALEDGINEAIDVLDVHKAHHGPGAPLYLHETTLADGGSAQLAPQMPEKAEEGISSRSRSSCLVKNPMPGPGSNTVIPSRTFGERSSWGPCPSFRSGFSNQYPSTTDTLTNSVLQVQHRTIGAARTQGHRSDFANFDDPSGIPVEVVFGNGTETGDYETPTYNGCLSRLVQARSSASSRSGVIRMDRPVRAKVS